MANHTPVELNLEASEGASPSQSRTAFRPCHGNGLFRLWQLCPVFLDLVGKSQNDAVVSIAGEKSMKFLVVGLSAIALLSGLAMIIYPFATIGDGGYVVLPTRFKGDINVTQANAGLFWSMLAVWVLGGGFLSWLGWKGLFGKD